MIGAAVVRAADLKHRDVTMLGMQKRIVTREKITPATGPNQVKRAKPPQELTNGKRYRNKTEKTKLHQKHRKVEMRMQSTREKRNLHSTKHTTTRKNSK